MRTTPKSKNTKQDPVYLYHNSMTSQMKGEERGGKKVSVLIVSDICMKNSNKKCFGSSSQPKRAVNGRCFRENISSRSKSDE